jgi:putative radical SAM enzyme (TIGR03279 family)
MMKNKRAGEVLSYLDRFFEAGLSMCGQIVLCRGVNDGDELLRTMRDLSRYYDKMGSVSIVPAGLTKHRDGLYPLADFTADEAGEVIDTVERFATEHKRLTGSRMFFLADEFYLKAGRPIPDADYYEEYPQIENGVGMIRSCSDEFGMAVRDLIEFADGKDAPRTVSLVTGSASYPMMKQHAERLMSVCPDLKVNIYEIINNFFGTSITVSGLLTGHDIYEQIKDKPLGEELLIPQNCLRHGEDVFLCGMTTGELSEKIGVPVRSTGNDGYELCEAILGRGI